LTIEALALSVCLLSVSAAVPAVRFAILGDRTGSHQPGVYESVVAEVERLRPDFVITVGDQIEGYTRDTAELVRQWDEYAAIVAGLSMPLHVVPGNHDITYDMAEPFFARRYGAPWRSFDAGGLHFIVLDNSRANAAEQMDTAQLRWLEADLKKSARARQTFVFMHKPFWFEQAFVGRPDTLHSLFRRYGVDAVFAGHYHYYFAGTLDGVRYTVLGSSGGDTEEGPTGLKFHFTWVTVTDSGVHIAPVKAGSVLPWSEVTTGEQLRIDSIARTAFRFDQPVRLDPALRARGTVNVTVNSPWPGAALRETLWWKLSPGWTAKPARQFVEVPAGGGAVVGCTLVCSGSPYPVPEVHLRFPYAEGRSVEVYDLLPVARALVCPAASAPPAIDGSLADPCWQNPVTGLFEPESGRAARTESTRFYFCRDAEALYLGAWCRETKPDSMVVNAADRDGAVYADDCAGWFLSPTGSDPVYQLYVNPSGTIFDQRIVEYRGDPAWNCACEVRTARGPGFWTAELKIPFSALDGARPGEWKVNFRRKQQRLGTMADWQVPITYNPATYGFMEMR